MGKTKIRYAASLGTHCYASWIMDRMGLRQYAMPFDWLFSSIRMVTHAINDDFQEFLKRDQYYRIDDHGRCGHHFYGQEPGLSLIFNHHDVTQDHYYAHFERATERFRKMLSSDGGKMFLAVTMAGLPTEEQSRMLSDALCARASDVHIVIIGVNSMDAAQSSISFERQSGAARIYRLDASSRMINGLTFANEIDNNLIEETITDQFDFDLARDEWAFDGEPATGFISRKRVGSVSDDRVSSDDGESWSVVPNNRVLFLQTADPIKYRRLLELSSKTVREYCNRHNHDCTFFLGISRGYHAWQATYNRIPLLRRIVDSGFKGWVCYLDADAFIVDLDFDLRGYLSDKSHIGFIAESDRQLDPDRPYWLVNAGVFLINLASVVGQTIVSDWAARFDAITDQQLREAIEWSAIVNDQDMLQWLLRDLSGMETSTLTLRAEPRLINYDGRFIKQVLRGAGSLEQRENIMSAEVSRVLRQISPTQKPSVSIGTNPAMMEEEFVKALYRVLLLREPDPGGLAAALENIRSGRLNFESAMRSCLASAEFRQKLPEVLATFIEPGGAGLGHNLTDLLVITKDSV